MVVVVSRRECGGVWLSCADHLRFAGAKPPTGICIHAWIGFCAVAVGRLVVVQGARYGHAIRWARVDGGGVGDVAVGSGIEKLYRLGYHLL